MSADPDERYNALCPPSHDFRYEPATDLFRCAQCSLYEVAAGPECSGVWPEGVQAELNMF